MFYVLQELAAFLHGFSRGYAIIHNQYIMYIVHVESFPPFSGLIDMPVAERVYVRDRQVQVERQQVGGKHATAGHADNEVEIPWQNAEMLQDAMVQVVYVTIVHVAFSFKKLSIMSYIFFTLCPSCGSRQRLCAVWQVLRHRLRSQHGLWPKAILPGWWPGACDLRICGAWCGYWLRQWVYP